MFRSLLIIITTIFMSQNLLSQNVQDMQRLKSEYEKVKNQNLREIPLNQQNIQNSDINDDPGRADLIFYDLSQDEDSTESHSRFFGYDFFTKRDTVGFWENLSIPQNYILGPGDEIIISLWGETSLRQTFTISRSGKIYDEKVGVLNISGKTVEKAKTYLVNQYGRIYSTLNKDNPSTFLDLSIGTLKSINVNFVGEVKFPGVYAVHPFSNVITGLIQAGGVDTTGSLRSISIKRNNKIYTKLDLYDYLLKGNLPNKIRLNDGDIVLVDIRKSTIQIDSSVFRPGVYELLNGESIKQLIDYAGGIKPNASTKIIINRITPHELRRSTTSNNENIYIDYYQSSSVLAQDGDVVTIKEMLENIQQVEMIGQVKKPGIYNYYTGMTLFDLIEVGGGFNDSTFWKSVYQSQAEIVRRDPFSRYEQVIKIDLSSFDKSSDLKKIKLENLDRFVVHSNLNFFEKKNIQINGEVNIPGSYPLISDNESLSNIIQRSGGLTKKALKNGISIFRDSRYFENTNEVNIQNNTISSSKVRVAWQSASITLMPGDSIIVKEETRTINVVGEVYNPGLIEFKKGKSLQSYINQAGGVTESGNKRAVVVVYANGVVIPNRWYSSPRIMDGCTIIVNEKEAREPFDITQFASNWTQIVSSLITAVVLSQQVSGN